MNNARNAELLAQMLDNVAICLRANAAVVRTLLPEQPAAEQKTTTTTKKRRKQPPNDPPPRAKRARVTLAAGERTGVIYDEQDGRYAVLLDSSESNTPNQHTVWVDCDDLLRLDDGGKLREPQPPPPPQPLPQLPPIAAVEAAEATGAAEATAAAEAAAAQARKEAEEAAKKAAEEKARHEAVERARQEAEASAAAAAVVEKARLEAEEKAKQEVEERARQRAAAAAAEQARKEAEAKAKEEEEGSKAAEAAAAAAAAAEQVRLEAEAKAAAEAAAASEKACLAVEENARKEAEVERARLEAEMAAQALLGTGIVLGRPLVATGTIALEDKLPWAKAYTEMESPLVAYTGSVTETGYPRIQTRLVGAEGAAAEATCRAMAGGGGMPAGKGLASLVVFAGAQARAEEEEARRAEEARSAEVARAAEEQLVCEEQLACEEALLWMCTEGEHTVRTSVWFVACPVCSSEATSFRVSGTLRFMSDRATSDQLVGIMRLAAEVGVVRVEHLSEIVAHLVRHTKAVLDWDQQAPPPAPPEEIFAHSVRFTTHMRGASPTAGSRSGGRATAAEA